MNNRVSPPTNPAVAAVNASLDALETQYLAESLRLVAAYRRVLPTLREGAARLLAELERIERATGAPVPETTVRGLRTYRALIDRLEAELGEFGVVTRSTAGALRDGAVQIALDGVLEAVAGQSELAFSVWRSPDPDMLARVIGLVDGDAMRGKLARFGANAAEDFADTLLALTAQGKGAREIARMVETWFGVPLGWAENTTRTVQHYSYRGATSASYQANRALLDGWLWQCALDVRSCLSCISQHGTLHSVDETLNDHHRGRCAMVPVVKGTTWAGDVETGRDWYGRLPDAVQRRIAGDRLWLALRDDPALWSSVSKAYEDDVFGTMLREASARELLADDGRYQDVARRAAGLPANGVSAAQAAVLAEGARTGT